MQNSSSHRLVYPPILTCWTIGEVTDEKRAIEGVDYQQLMRMGFYLGALEAIYVQVRPKAVDEDVEFVSRRWGRRRGFGARLPTFLPRIGP